jgi:hypothetical protein
MAGGATLTGAGGGSIAAQAARLNASAAASAVSRRGLRRGAAVHPRLSGGLADLDSRSKTVIKRAARPDRLTDQRADRSSHSRQGRLQLARNHDRRTAMRNKLKIKARTRKANPADLSLDDDEPAVATSQFSRI